MSVIAGVVQMTSGGDVAKNLARAAELIGEAASRGARLVVLPENFALLGEHERDKFAVAEKIPGAIVGAMAEAAKKHSVSLVLGGMPEKGPDDAHVHNTSVYLDATGAVRGVYRKIHLFDVQIPDGAEYRESASVAPGSETVVVETPWAMMGLSVCYDLRFPELYRRQAEAGARILTVPAAFTLHTGRDHWHVLLRARAVENLCYVLAAAQYGKHNAKRVTYGHALIADPWGQVLAECGDHEGVAVAELDFAYQDKVRRELPSLGHRRL
jgi:predicted amidohydrolase